MPGHYLAQRYLAQRSWDGTRGLKSISQASSRAVLTEMPALTKNIRDIPDIDSVLHELDYQSLQTSDVLQAATFTRMDADQADRNRTEHMRAMFRRTMRTPEQAHSLCYRASASAI